VQTGSDVTVNGNLNGGSYALNAGFTLNGNISTSVASSAISSNSGTHNINGDVINTNAAGVTILHNSGILNITGGTITSTGANAVINKTTAGGRISLRNAYLNAGVGATNSIASTVSINVNSRGSQADIPVSSIVNVIGDLKVDSASEATAGDVATVLADGTWSWASLPPQIVASGNVAVVDDVNGNDSTGVVGRLDRPFFTLLAAQTAASAGTTIVVYPGSYTSNSLGKDGVNWYFMPGATVTTVGNVFNALTAMSFTVAGYGALNGTGRLVQISSGTSNISIQCNTANTSNGFGISASGSIKINVLDSWTIGNGVSSQISSASASVYIKARVINIGNGLTTPFTPTAGSLRIDADINCTAAMPNLVQHGGGAIEFRNSAIETSLLAGAVIDKTLGTGSILLDNCRITAPPTQDTIASLVTLPVTSMGSYIDRPVSGSVQVIGDLHYEAAPTTPTVGQVPTANADGTWSWA